MRGGLESFLIKKLCVTRRPWLSVSTRMTLATVVTPGDHSRDIIDLHIHIGRIGRRRLKICGALVIDADQVHTRIGRIDRKVALAVGLGLARSPACAGRVRSA